MAYLISRSRIFVTLYNNGLRFLIIFRVFLSCNFLALLNSWGSDILFVFLQNPRPDSHFVFLFSAIDFRVRFLPDLSSHMDSVVAFPFYSTMFAVLVYSKGKGSTPKE